MSASTIGRVDQLIQQAKKDRDNLAREVELYDKFILVQERARSELAADVIKRATVPTTQNSVSRAALLQDILVKKGADMTIDDIMRALEKRRGHPDDRRLTHATLSYLQRKGVAKSVDRGVWQAVAAA